MAVILGQALRGPGTFYTPNFSLDASRSGKTVQITPILDPGDERDESLQLHLGWERHVGGGVWEHVGSARLVMGWVNPKTGLPETSYFRLQITPDLISEPLRGVFYDLPRELNIGIDATWLN